MKRQTFAICALVALAAATACRRSEIQDQDSQKITIRSSVNGVNHSKAIANPLAELTGIQMLRKDNAQKGLTTVNFVGVNPIVVTRDAGADAEIIFPEIQKYDKQSDNSVYFVGYHPAGTVNATTETVSWTPDGATDILVSELYDAGYYTAQNPHTMIFTHALARIEIVIEGRVNQNLEKIREVWGTITNVNIEGVPTTLVYDYATNKATSGKTIGTTELLKGKTYTIDAADPSTDGVIGTTGNRETKFASMVVPVDKTELTLNVTNYNLEGTSQSKIVAYMDGKLLAGKTHRLTISFGSSPNEILVSSSTIVEWDNTGSEGDGGMANPPKNASILIDGVKWATGNLVATSSTARGFAPGSGVTIGAPTDGGLYFQFGSLIGYKGGNIASSGAGRGIPHGSTTSVAMPDGRYWNQSTTWSFANDAMVWPASMMVKPIGWRNNTSTAVNTFTDYYFSYNVAPYATKSQSIAGFEGFTDGAKADVGVGDPCRYYLGGAWRLPTTEEWVKLFNDKSVGSAYGPTTKTLKAAGYTNAVISPVVGRGIYANTAATTEAEAQLDPTALFFPATGWRSTTGAFTYVGLAGYGTSSSVNNATTGLDFDFNVTQVNAQSSCTRSIGLPVRCVQTLSVGSDRVNNVVPVEASVFTLTIAGTNDENWTLVETGDTYGAFTPSATSGTGDGTFTVTVTANTAETPREASYTLSTASGLTATITLKQQRVMPANTIEAGGLFWATGNLVADASVAPGSGVATGTNGTKVKIGEPTDGGLYFQFGSLIGYKGGNAASLGRGTGIPHGATTTNPMPDDKWWNQATAYSWANEAMVWPQAYTNGAATWPQNKADNGFYFGLRTPPYSSAGQKLSAFPDWESGGLVTSSSAVGDPCRYYLGGGWRMPTAEDWGKLFNSVYANGPVGGTWPGLDKDWVYGTATKTVMAGITSRLSATEGVGIYANTTATTEAAAKADPGALFFPASGSRNTSNGSFGDVGRLGYSWSGSVAGATYGFYLYFTAMLVHPQYSYYRSYGFPVRCVSEP